MYVRWAGVLSPGFHVSNGVRQGGILSPYLFNVYMDDLSTALNGCHTGYVVDNIPVKSSPICRRSCCVCSLYFGAEGTIESM